MGQRCNCEERVMAEKECIERKSLYDFCKDQIEEETGAYSKGRNAGLRVAMSAVMNKDAIPAADARPVVRGKWIVSRTDYGWNGAEFPTHCKCTVCGREVPYQDKDNYCPNCGADMMEES